MKAVVILLLTATLVAANPQFGFAGFGGFGGFGMGGPNSQFYQALLDRELQKLLATPDFPEDLAQRAMDTVNDAQTAFENCTSAAYPLPYMQRICIVRTYAAARAALNAISQEAQARAQTTPIPNNQPAEAQA